MKDFFIALLSLLFGVVGCVAYLIVFGIAIIFALWMGILVINWIF